MTNELLKKRFLKYVSFDTQSSEESTTLPSTKKQLLLANYLSKELKEIGVNEAFCDEHGYVYGYIPSNVNCNNTIGLIAHIDTSNEASGANIKPQFIPSYDGSDIILNEELNLKLSVEKFPYLLDSLHHELITTDGTTLLGADDKAGIAIIMEALYEVLQHNLPHPNILITFTPDEEVGRGTEGFNFDYYKEKNCKFAYTLDGGEQDIINYENFNAAGAIVTITGESIHPGSAKNKMINAILLANEFNALLPSNMIPSLTSDYEGFNHLIGIEGSVSKTTMHYIIRNHDMNIFNAQKLDFYNAMEFMNKKYHKDLVKVDIKDSYFNMKELVKACPEVLEKAENALKALNITPKYVPIRGGTDGARLSFGGIITPNLGTGGRNYHGPFEYLDLDEASNMVEVVKELLKQYL